MKYLNIIINYVLLLFFIILNISFSSAIDCNIKWNISYESWKKIYHLPWCKYYNETIIDYNYWERMFCNEEEALSAWWVKSEVCGSNNEPSNNYTFFLIVIVIIFLYFYYKKPNNINK